jgi:hypothetical protein
VDDNLQALETMANRFTGNLDIEWIEYELKPNI